MSPLSRFIAASGLTNLADGVATVAWAWLASLLTRDAMLIALVPVALRLPWFLCALPAGIVADRVDRRRLILTMDAVRAAAYGLMLATMAADGIAGALPGEGIVRRLGPARTMQVTLSISSLGFALMALAPGPVAMGLALALFEAAGLAWNIVSVSYRQRAIPPGLLGRVNSLYRLLAWGMMPMGLVLSGLVIRLAEGAMPRGQALVIPFWLAAIGMAVTTLAVWHRLRRGFGG